MLAGLVGAPISASASTANLPAPGGGNGHPRRTPIKMYRHDSKIPTYDYVVFNFDKRATYEIGYKANGITTMVEMITIVAAATTRNAWVGAAGALATGASKLVAQKAQGAEHDGKCLAVKFFVQRKKFFNPPGPDVLLTSVYSSSTNCKGSYADG